MTTYHNEDNIIGGFITHFGRRATGFYRWEKTECLYKKNSPLDAQTRHAKLSLQPVVVPDPSPPLMKPLIVTCYLALFWNGICKFMSFLGVRMSILTGTCYPN